MRSHRIKKEGPAFASLAKSCVTIRNVWKDALDAERRNLPNLVPRFLTLQYRDPLGPSRPGDAALCASDESPEVLLHLGWCAAPVRWSL